jgi:hypothetical protein
MSRPSEIHGKEYQLTKVFGGEFLFRIPLYQRPYAWTTEEAGELMDDLVAAMGEPEESDPSPYFLGSIVLIKGAAPDSDVVDGQQRLTTLTLIIAALRHSIHTPEWRTGLTARLYEAPDVVAGIEARFRLSVRERDLDFFRKYVQREGGIGELIKLDVSQLEDARKRLVENARLFVDRLQKMTEQERVWLARYLAMHCYVIVVSTPNLESAFRIFSILNDRGLDLSLTDILKSEVIGNITPDKQASYATKWETVEGEIGREAFEELFAHIRMIYAHTKARRNMLEEFRDHVKPAANPTRFVDDVLVPYASAYDRVKNSAYESTSQADEVNGWLRKLNRIDNFDWIPPAVLYVAKHGDSPAMLVGFLAKLERLAATMMIRRANVNERIERYGHVLADIAAARDPFRAGAPVLANDTSEAKEVLQLLDGPIYLSAKIRSYVLTRLDEELADKGVTYDHEVITVEHVLPQNPRAGSEWVQWFPDEKARAGWVHRIGNLVLLSRRKNSEASNLGFAEKKDKYFRSKKTKIADFAITMDVLREEKWTPEILAKRQQDSLETLRRAWSL